MSQQPMIRVSELHFAYLRGTPMEVTALRGICLEVRRGERVGIIGRAGSGKSTLVQHFNGLLRPDSTGQVLVAGSDLGDPATDFRHIHQQIGLVFQTPEQQLFERLVGDDIAFGPKQLGIERPERRERVRWAMEMVGLDFDAFKDRLTLSLSGGEMRKVAVAGVLALRPEVLVLDESTSGLDPSSRREMLRRLDRLHHEENTTLVLVSSSMEEIAEHVDRVYVLENGSVAMHGSVREVFAHPEQVRKLGLDVPQVTAIAHELALVGLTDGTVPLSVPEGAELLLAALGLHSAQPGALGTGDAS